MLPHQPYLTPGSRGLLAGSCWGCSLTHLEHRRCSVSLIQSLSRATTVQRGCSATTRWQIICLWLTSATASIRINRSTGWTVARACGESPGACRVVFSSSVSEGGLGMSCALPAAWREASPGACWGCFAGMEACQQESKPKCKGVAGMQKRLRDFLATHFRLEKL